MGFYENEEAGKMPSTTRGRPQGHENSEAGAGRAAEEKKSSS